MGGRGSGGHSGHKLKATEGLTFATFLDNQRRRIRKRLGHVEAHIQVDYVDHANDGMERLHINRETAIERRR